MELSITKTELQFYKNKVEELERQNTGVSNVITVISRVVVC